MNSSPEVPALPRYETPPEDVSAILQVPPTPIVSMSPARDRLLLVQGIRYPPIAELAEPMLRLAGIRVNPRTNGRYRAPCYVGLTLKSLVDGSERTLLLPDESNLGFPAWSPDGSRFAFTNTTSRSIELWVGLAESGELRRIEGVSLNPSRGGAAQWMPDSRALLCHTVPEGRGPAPEAPQAPFGPVIQESVGRAAPVRTYPDALQSPQDEVLFDYYFTSQLVLANTETAEITPVGTPGIFDTAQVSPDGEHILVALNHRPYSYLLYANAFPKAVEIWDRAGTLEYRLASLPLAEHVPIEGVPTGPRSYHWHPTDPATLLWAEALDEGDPRNKAAYRDRVLLLKGPFTTEPVELARTEHRFAGLGWLESGSRALLTDYDRDRRWVQTFIISVEPGEEPRLLWSRSVKDRYGDPGDPVNRLLPTGKAAIWQHQDAIYLTGQGATPEGDRPFLDRLDLRTLESQRLFQSAGESLESVAALLADDASTFITRYESRRDPPNYFIRGNGEEQRRPLTSFPDPAPQLQGIRKEIVTYRREDGVPLSFTLYLPPGYQEGTRLPTVVWAYPQEFNDPDTAGQIAGSPYRFTTLMGTSHLFFLTQGYAVLDNPTMPVIGDPETMNDTFIEQVVASARAAVEKAAEMGVTDPDRVGIGGHSYGAFMTATLMAHSDLFQAGIARSGAYNRTLTPFGFQSERRTLWEAPETYVRLSPFMYAHQIKKPILFIHGAADNNAGTYPVQTERMFQAVKGNGGIARMVMLPFESHGYEARESVEHTLHEMITWFDRYVKAARG